MKAAVETHYVTSLNNKKQRMDDSAFSSINEIGAKWG